MAYGWWLTLEQLGDRSQTWAEIRLMAVGNVRRNAGSCELYGESKIAARKWAGYR